MLRRAGNNALGGDYEVAISNIKAKKGGQQEAISNVKAEKKATDWEAVHADIKAISNIKPISNIKAISNPPLPQKQNKKQDKGTEQDKGTVMNKAKIAQKVHATIQEDLFRRLDASTAHAYDGMMYAYDEYDAGYGAYFESERDLKWDILELDQEIARLNRLMGNRDGRRTHSRSKRYRGNN